MKRSTLPPLPGPPLASRRSRRGEPASASARAATAGSRAASSPRHHPALEQREDARRGRRRARTAGRSAANARAVSSWPLAVSSACPSPASAPAHSANTAPITDTAAATFSPVKAAGSAAGASRSGTSASARRRRSAAACARRGRRAQAVVEVDGDGEEADERDEQHLRREAEAEHEDRPAARSPGTGTACEPITSGRRRRGPWGRRACRRRAPRRATAAARPDQHLLGGDREVVAEQARSSHSDSRPRWAPAGSAGPPSRAPTTACQMRRAP